MALSASIRRQPSTPTINYLSMPSLRPKTHGQPITVITSWPLGNIAVPIDMFQERRQLLLMPYLEWRSTWSSSVSIMSCLSTPKENIQRHQHAGWPSLTFDGMMFPVINRGTPFSAASALFAHTI